MMRCGGIMSFFSPPLQDPKGNSEVWVRLIGEADKKEDFKGPPPAPAKDAGLVCLEFLIISLLGGSLMQVGPLSEHPGEIIQTRSPSHSWEHRKFTTSG